MKKYTYKTILSKDEIAKHNRRQKWLIGIFAGLFGTTATLATWTGKPSADGEISLLATVCVYLLPVIFGFYWLGFRFIPNCMPITVKQITQLLSWREQFTEVDERVLAILSERDFVLRCEFEEIERRVAVLPALLATTDDGRATQGAVAERDKPKIGGDKEE